MTGNEITYIILLIATKLHFTQYIMETNSKYLVILSIVILVLIGYFFLRNNHENKVSMQKDSKKITVITTLFPLYDFARAVGGGNVEVSLLLPPGVEPHSFEPKPADVVKINSAEIFIYTGKFMEVWAEDIIKGVINKNLLVVDTSKGITLMKENEEHEHENKDEHEEESKHEHHHHGGVDPHVWLNFDNTKIMVKNIADALIYKDPSHKKEYEANLEQYISKLNQLDVEYKSTLSTCRHKEIVYGGHYAFGYLAKRYGLNYLAAEGVSADSEPTTHDMIHLVNQVKENNIKYIYYEELTSPKIAETIAKETNAKMLLLNAAHNVTKKQVENGVSYIEIMNDNLNNLKVGLECE